MYKANTLLGNSMGIFLMDLNKKKTLGVAGRARKINI